MIFDHIDHVDTYTGIDQRIWKGLELLKTQDFSQMEVGRYEVEGSDLFFMVQAYQSKTENYKTEAHEKYVDIQYLYGGVEHMGVAPLTANLAPTISKPEKDVYFYDTDVDMVTMTPNTFMVLWPQDLHTPGVAVDGLSVPCKKIVVKVKIT